MPESITKVIEQVAKLGNKSLDGMWHALYANALPGLGYIMLRSGKVLGCDARYFIEGTYEVSAEGKVTVEIALSHYRGEPRTIVGDSGPVILTSYSVYLSGEIDAAGTLLLTGFVNGNRDLFTSAQLIRLIPPWI
jgi:hypothetical protein